MKKMRLIVCLSIGFCVFAFSSVQAQQALLRSADREFKAFNFIKAIELYQQVYHRNADVRAAEGLAEAYYQIKNYREAELWYARLANQDQPRSEHILHYGHVLRNNSKFREAKAQYQRVAQRADNTLSTDELGTLYASCDSAVVWLENPLSSVEVWNQKSLNTAQSEFGASPSSLGLIFTSDRFGSSASSEIYGWTGNPYLSLYNYTGAEIVPMNMRWSNRANHLGPATFSDGSNEAYFAVTRPLTRKERRRAAKDVTVNIEIFSNQLDAADWGVNMVPFRYNNITEWSVGDPFLVPSGDTLYFSSNMPGGFGGTDIYYVTRTASGDWGEAVNLGAAVNTSGDERFPGLDAAGNFYFSSDGHIGMGGLDVYRLDKSNGRAKVVNLGYPFNSPNDDFSIRFEQGSEGYFASNRYGGAGADDIYRFNLDKVIKLDLSGAVYNAKTRLPIASAAVTLTPVGDELNAVVLQAGADGRFRFNLSEGRDYVLHAAQTGFREVDPIQLTTKGIDSSTTVQRDIFLQPVEKAEVVVLRNIYFDFDKAEIRPDAALELDKVLSFLNSDPDARIELSAHTDSRGTHDYNMKLSQRRADSAIAYLVSRGISQHRLVAKGYGFTRLANHCDKGVECSEEEHEFNRRIEFFVIN